MRLVHNFTQPVVSRDDPVLQVLAATFLPERDQVALSCSDKCVYLYSLDDYSCTGKIQTHAIQSAILWVPTRSVILLADRTGAVKAFDVDSGLAKATLKHVHGAQVTCLVLVPQAGTVATGARTTAPFNQSTARPLTPTHPRPPACQAQWTAPLRSTTSSLPTTAIGGASGATPRVCAAPSTPPSTASSFPPPSTPRAGGGTSGVATMSFGAWPWDCTHPLSLRAPTPCVNRLGRSMRGHHYPLVGVDFVPGSPMPLAVTADTMVGRRRLGVLLLALHHHIASVRAGHSQSVGRAQGAQRGRSVPADSDPGPWQHWFRAKVRAVLAAPPHLLR